MAIAALTSAGYSLCVDQNCYWNTHKFEHPPGTVHFDTVKDSRLWGPLRLYTKSSVLWWLPDPTPTLPTLDDPHYMLTDDKRLPPRTWPRRDLDGNLGPDGPWLNIYPVRIVKPILFTEALILLCCRDHNHVNNFEDYWRGLLGAMNEENPDPDFYLRKRVRPELQKCWNVAKVGNDLQINAAVKQLREELIASLPATPYYYGFRTKERAIRQGSRWL
ncbi:hypothetical protein N7456_005719 [Penicillium angulare]|uniref:Uncharacterized protein n=1 Tax=Penicillium angulare TaxID=116970 RepID=A0A9W9FYX3_9EURO|nr:hypothetical protein N7456_005719 [Penicillium angulare]